MTSTNALPRIALAGLFAMGLSGQGHSVELSVLDRTLLIEAGVVGKAMAPVVIAAQEGASATVADAVTKAGGRVVLRHDDIGYLYAELPLDAVQVFAQRQDLAALQVATHPVRGEAGLDEPGAEGSPKTGTAPGPWLQPDNPYTGEAATQAALFKSLHPDWAGRWRDARLRRAGRSHFAVHARCPRCTRRRSAQICRLRYRLVRALRRLHRQSIWRVVAEHRGCSRRGRRHRAYRRACLSASQGGRRIPMAVMSGGYPNRRPHHAAWAILWGVSTRKVWIAPLSAQNFDMAVVADVRAPYFIARIGQRGAGTADRTLLTWVMKATKGMGSSVPCRLPPRHPAMVASVMAGDNFLGSAAGGCCACRAAGGCSITGGRMHPARQLLKNHLAMLRSGDVDVAESSASVGDSSRDRPSVYAVLEQRLQERTRKPFTKAQGNFGPFRGGVEEMSTAADTFAIGGYVPQATWKANFGYEPRLGGNSGRVHRLGTRQRWRAQTRLHGVDANARRVGVQVDRLRDAVRLVRRVGRHVGGSAEWRGIDRVVGERREADQHTARHRAPAGRARHDCELPAQCGGASAGARSDSSQRCLDCIATRDPLGAAGILGQGAVG